VDAFVNKASHVLVCGLGSLGQQCVTALKAFGMQISAIELVQPRSWEVQNLPELLEQLIIGDCRQPSVLQQGIIEQCRAVLLVTNNERINIEAAFAVRLLNSQVRLVVRSSEHQLNQLLDQQLGNFTALEMAELSAPALAIAALANETKGLITLDNQLLRVLHHPIDLTHRWCDLRLAHELNNRTRRILSHSPDEAALPIQFHQWEPEARIRAGDRVTYIEVIQDSVDLVQPTSGISSAGNSKQTVGHLGQNLLKSLSRTNLRQIPLQIWQFTAQQQTKRVAILVGITVLLLILLGTTILKSAHPQQSWLKALYVTSVMLLGSYDVVFGALSSSDTTPLWMRFLNLSYMLAGTASIAVLYALLTESLLAAKFALPNKRPPVPLQDHVVLIGLDQVNRQIATYLQTLKQPLVGVSDAALEPSVLPEMPLVVSDFREALKDVNLTTAKSVVVATNNEMANLEIGLMAHAANSDASLVIQTFEPDFSSNIDRLLPYAKVLCSYSLAAEAFAAAVFGDHILDLLRLSNQTVLVAEYDVQAEDGLHSLLLAEVACGYGVVPILYQDQDYAQAATLLPSEDIKLEVGDRMVILATVDSLYQIDQREPLPRCWQVLINTIATQSIVFEGIRTIVRITGCSLSTATEVMNQLPTIVPKPLYKHQALRLVRELSKIQIQAHLIPFSPTSLE
jgi:Trk K+ transport system NAD-binding subunit